LVLEGLFVCLFDEEIIYLLPGQRIYRLQQTFCNGIESYQNGQTKTFLA